MTQINDIGGNIYRKKVTSKKNQAQLLRVVEVMEDLVQHEKLTKKGSKQKWECKYLCLTV